MTEAEFATNLIFKITNGRDLTAEEMEYLYRSYSWVDIKDTIVDGRILTELVYEFNGKFYLTSMYYDGYNDFEFDTAAPFVEVELKKVVIETEEWVKKENT